MAVLNRIQNRVPGRVLARVVGLPGVSYLLRIAATGQNYFNGSPATLASFLSHSRIGSATYQDSSGLIQTAAQDELRYDYTTGRRALLFEAQRTNRVTHSRNLAAIVAQLAGGSFTEMPGELAPDGTAGGVYRLQLPATSSTFLRMTATATTAIRNVSGYAKNYNGVPSDFGMYDVSGSSAISQSRFSASDEWQRYSITPNRGTSNANDLGYNNTDDTYAVDILCAFFNVSDGAELTSYIPSAGSSATRAADFASPDISAIDLSGGFSVYFDGAITSAGRVFQLTSTAGNRIYLDCDGTNLVFEVYSGGVLQASYTSSGISIGDDFKFAARVEANNINVAFNGTAATSDTSATFVDPDTMHIASSDGTSLNKPAQLHITELRIDATLTDAELEALTA